MDSIPYSTQNQYDEARSLAERPCGFRLDYLKMSVFQMLL